MKTMLEKKKRQQVSNEVNLLIEINLKEKKRTHKTSIRIRVSEMLTVPLCVIVIH